MADGHADSAGIPFAGRRFEPNAAAGDDGSAPERVVEAIRRLHAGELGIAEVVEALHPERLLVPLIAEAGDEGIGPHGQRVDKTQELSIVTVAGPDGRSVLPAFTSTSAMRAWNPDARPIPIQASRVALAAASEGTPLIVVDPGSETQTVVRGPAFRALATGEPWTPSFEDLEVAEAFGASVAEEDAVAAIGLAPGDPQARLAGAEVLVVLRIAVELAEAERQALLARLQARWAADELIASRVDSIAVRLSSGDGARPLLAGALAVLVGEGRRLAEGELHGAQAVAQGSRMMVAEARCGCRDEPGEGVDELARLVEIQLGLGVVGQADLDGGGAQQVHRDRVDDLDGGHIRDVADLLGHVLGIDDGRLLCVHGVPLLFLCGLRGHLPGNASGEIPPASRFFQVIGSE